MAVSLRLIQQNGDVTVFPIADQVTYIGRSPKCQVQINSNTISRCHACIEKQGNNYQIADLGSANGTAVNDQQLPPHQPVVLHHQDWIKVDIFEMQFLITEIDVVPTHLIPSDTVEYQEVTGTTSTLTIDFTGKSRLLIGRHEDNDIVIPYPAVSKFHAVLLRVGSQIYIKDLQSRNGTFVNGQRVTGKKALPQGDLVKIASYTLLLNKNASFTPVNQTGKLQLDAIDLCKVVNDSNTGSKRLLLNHLSLSILPKEFVVIAGVSGGGKSTLIDALSGFRPATSGVVLVNGIDLYKNYDAYRNEIGYVPQQDIVHTELTVYQALSFSSRLRMPSDTTKAEREKRIDQVLKELKLIERKHTMIANLSGGQGC